MATEWDVFSLPPGGSADPPTYLATLYDAREKTIRVELDGTGSGQFRINKSSSEATAAILAQGNLVKVRVPEIDTDYVFAFFIETGDFTLVSSDEAGGDMLQFGGRGALAYLEYGRAWNHSYIAGGQDPFDGLWRAYAAGTGKKPGQILGRVIEELQDADRPQNPIPLLTIDFDYTDDSNGDPWASTDATDEFTYQVGEDALSIVNRLVATDEITVQMGPDFDLHAYNDYGRDLTASIRFEKGVNIASELHRELQADRVATHVLVAGETDHYGSATLAGAASRVTKEAFVTSFGTGATALNAAGAVELRQRLKKSDRIMFPIANRRTAVSLADPVTVGSVLGPDATAGAYLPGPPSSANGDFWLGDLVRVHTGVGDFDYNQATFQVVAITITRDDDNHELIVIPELEFRTQVTGLHQVVLSSRGNCGVAVYTAHLPAGVPTTLVFGGACGGGLSYATPTIVQDTDGYAVRVEDPLATVDACDPFGDPCYVQEIVIPAGLGGEYRASWGNANTSFPNGIPAIFNGVTIEGEQVEYLWSDHITDIGATSTSGTLEMAVCVNGTPVPALTYTHTFGSFHHGASKGSGTVDLVEGDVVTMRATYSVYSGLTNSIGIGVFGEQQGIFALTRIGD